MTARRWRTLAASGRLFRTILAAFAEYEREIISQQIKAGVKLAREKGKKWGARKKGQRTRLTDDTVKAVKALVDQGIGKRAIARQLRIGEASVYRALEL